MSNSFNELLGAVRLAAFDFDGVFTDNFVYVSESGSETVRCSRLDGIGLARLKAANVYPVIISTETNQVVQQRANKLGVQCIHSVENKLEVLTELVARRELQMDQVMFLGNDINDISALEAVGLPIAVADAVPEILPYVKLVTKKSGGHGAVREVCDLIWLHNKQVTHE